MSALELTPEGQLRVMPLSVIQELIHERNTLREERDEANKELHKQLEKYDALFDEAEKIRMERDEAREALREIAAADWKTSGELRGMARRVLEAAK